MRLACWTDDHGGCYPALRIQRQRQAIFANVDGLVGLVCSQVEETGLGEIDAMLQLGLDGDAAHIGANTQRALEVLPAAMLSTPLLF